MWGVGHRARSGVDKRHEALRHQGRGRRPEPEPRARRVSRPPRPQRRRQVHDDQDGHRSHPSERGSAAGARARRRAQPARRQAPDRSAAGGARPAGSADRSAVPALRRAHVRPRRRRDRQTPRRAVRAARPPARAGPADLRLQLWHEEEDGALCGAASRAADAVPGRAVRGHRPGDEPHDTDDPGRPEPARRDAGADVPRAGDRGEALPAHRHPARGPAAGPRDARRAAGPARHDGQPGGLFASLMGGAKGGELSWL